jgi:competence protein ComEC
MGDQRGSRALRSWFLFVLLLLVPPCGGDGQLPDDRTARLVFLDVGQGDAIIIQSPEGKVALVDAGPGDGIAEDLRRHGIDSIDVAIATHPHADHIGGMAQVIRSMPVRYYMDNGVPHTTRTYRELMDELRRSDITYLEASARNLELGSVTLRVIPPPVAEGHNDRSIGLVVEFGPFRALMTGDSEVGELNHFLSLGMPDVDVLKAAHHGARDAVSPAWLSATKPEVVVISCGRDNRYGHPDPWALRYYETVARDVFRTDLDGEVIVTIGPDGEYAVVTGRARSLAIPSSNHE